MTLYNMRCNRCDGNTTHESLMVEPDDPEDSLAVKHPEYDNWVVCRECKTGRSKADLPEEGVSFWVTATVETGLSIRVAPWAIPNGVSLTEHIEQELKDRRGELAGEIADGIRAEQVEMHGLPESEELSGFPPNW